MLSHPFCCTDLFKASCTQNNSKSDIARFLKSVCSLVWLIPTVQFVKQRFWGVMCVPRIDFCHSFPAYSYMFLQIQCSAAKFVTIRAAKVLETCINFVHVAYVVIVSQQSHSIFFFLHTSSTKFFDIFLNHNIYSVQQNVES